MSEGKDTEVVRAAVIAAGKDLGLAPQEEHKVPLAPDPARKQELVKVDVAFAASPGGRPSVFVEIDHQVDRGLYNPNKYFDVPAEKLPAALVCVRFGQAAEPYSFLDPTEYQKLPGFFLGLDVDPNASDLQSRIRNGLESMLSLPASSGVKGGIPDIETQYEKLLLLGSGSSLVASHLSAREQQAWLFYQQGRVEREDLVVLIGAQFSLMRRAGNYREASEARAKIYYLVPDLWERATGISQQTADILRRNDVLAKFATFDEPDAGRYLREGYRLIKPTSIRMTLRWRQALTTSSPGEILEILEEYQDSAGATLITMANTALARTVWLLRERPMDWQSLAREEAHEYFRRERDAWNVPGHGGTFHGVLAAVHLVAEVLMAAGEGTTYAERWAREVDSLMRVGNISGSADGFRETASLRRNKISSPLSSASRSVKSLFLLADDIEARVKRLVGEVEDWFVRSV